MADSRLEAKKEQGSLNYHVPQSSDMLREHEIQLEVSAIGQIWDYLVIKIENGRNMLNTKRTHESLLILKKLRNRRKIFLYRTVTITF